MSDTPSLTDLLEALLPVAREAGRAIMRIYATPFVVHDKNDDSPVTEADHAAEAIILASLARLTPDIVVVAEEQVAAGHTPRVGNEFWLVDPLDGTREFIKKNGEFTVNIGLIRDGVPQLGIVFAPAIDRLFAGCADDNGALAFEERGGQRDSIACRAPPREGLVVACSRSHGSEHDLDRFLKPYRVSARLRMGSSVKFGLVAAGEADLYPRLSPTMEWDTAAGHAVVRAAGGALRDLDGAELRYAKPGFRNGNFVAWGSAP